MEVGGAMIETRSFGTDAVVSDEAAIEAFLEDCRLRNMQPGTLEGYKSRLLASSQILRRNGLSICKLDKESLRTILVDLRERRVRNKPFAFNNLLHYFAALSSFCDYLIWNDISETNPVRPFQKRYLRQLKTQHGAERKLISVNEMAILINSILDPRDKAIVTLLAKTGIRRGELIRIDVDEIDWAEQSIRLKPHPKRSNCVVFFDDETARVLQRWMRARQNYQIENGCQALFVNEQGGRLERHGVSEVVTKHAQRVGLHNPDSRRMEDHFTPHCCRHWFTTYLRKNEMRRELIQELRGDSRNETIDIYDHIDKKELKRAYLAAIPVLGIE
jgi:integrase/recombinase XerD